MFLAVFIVFGLFLASTKNVFASRLAQQPTVDVPTVTGTKSGPVAAVNLDQDMIHVRSGPGENYSVIGLLVAGQKVPAMAQSAGGDWIQIVYLGVPGSRGWVHKNLINITGGALQVVTPPPTQAPQVTPTLEPTLAARYLVVASPTNLPTFTPAPPVSIPTFVPAVRVSVISQFPVGFIIIGLAVVGFFGTMITLLRGR